MSSQLRSENEPGSRSWCSCSRTARFTIHSPIYASIRGQLKQPLVFIGVNLSESVATVFSPGCASLEPSARSGHRSFGNKSDSRPFRRAHCRGEVALSPSARLARKATSDCIAAIGKGNRRDTHVIMKLGACRIKRAPRKKTQVLVKGHAVRVQGAPEITRVSLFPAISSHHRGSKRPHEKRHGR